MAQESFEQKTTQKSERRAERLVHFSLLAGLALAAVLLALGLLVGLVRGEPETGGEPPALPQLVLAALGGNGQALMNLGLMALMVTPVLRVAMLILGWTAAGERRFALVALAVLALLSLSMLLGVG